MEGGVRREIEKPRRGERNGDTDWERWRVTEKDMMKTETRDGTAKEGGGERQRDRYNRAIKTPNNETAARSHIVQLSHFTNGETEAQVEQETSTSSAGVNSE